MCTVPPAAIRWHLCVRQRDGDQAERNRDRPHLQELCAEGRISKGKRKQAGSTQIPSQLFAMHCSLAAVHALPTDKSCCMYVVCVSLVSQNLACLLSRAGQ
jgi:hypothetical protein